MEQPGTGLEIERKYIVALPDEALLLAQPGCVKVRVRQVYLKSTEPGVSRRVRRWEENGKVDYRRTEKRRISAVTREETETEITAEEFEARRQNEADPLCREIEKVRYRIPYEGQLIEIDAFPFWHKQALLEVELESEEQTILFPPYITVIREVTEDGNYTNRAIAKKIPEEDTL